MVGGRRASDRNFASDLKLEHEYIFVYILEFETRLIEISLAGETDVDFFFSLKLSNA